MSIVIKGIKQGVLVNLVDAGDDWNALLTELVDYIEQRGAFFKGAQWVVDLNHRSVGKDSLLELKEKLGERQVELLALLSTNEETLAAAHALELFTDLNAIPTRSRGLTDTNIEPEEEEGYVVPPMDSEEYGTGGVLI